MAYRRTENVSAGCPPVTTRSLRRRATPASAGGMAAIQIAPIAARAGIAAGTVYRYFPARSIWSAR